MTYPHGRDLLSDRRHRRGRDLAIALGPGLRSWTRNRVAGEVSSNLRCSKRTVGWVLVLSLNSVGKISLGAQIFTTR